MPIFEYKCDDCGYIVEDLRIVEERTAEIYPCPECGHGTLHIITLEY